MNQEDETRRSNERTTSGQTKLLLGRVASVLGILMAATVVLFPGFTMTAVISTVALGGAGYVLGARRLGAATVIIAAAALIFGILALIGYIPGLSPRA